MAVGTDAAILFIPLSLQQDIPFPANVAESSGTAVASSALIGALAGSPASVSEGARGQIAFQIASCQTDIPLQTTPLSWNRSPTFMSIGQDGLQYNRGAVVGNWVLLTSMGLIHGGLTAYLGAQKTHFPGALIFPVLFLVPPTATAAMNLIRYGGAGDKTLGVFSIGAQTLGTLGMALFLRPSSFKAEWDFEKLDWGDTSQEGYVAQYGFAFRNYYDQRQWFQACELLFSIAAGSLNAFQTGQSSCLPVLSVGAATYGAFAVVVIVLRPTTNTFNRVYSGGASSMQFLSILLSLIGTSTDSFTLKQAGSGLAIVMQWVTTARSIGNLLVSLGRNLFLGTAVIKNVEEEIPQVSLLGEHLNDQEMLSFDVPAEVPAIELVVVPPSPINNSPIDILSEHSEHSTPPMTPPLEISRASTPSEESLPFSFYQDSDNLNPLDELSQKLL